MHIVGGGGTEREMERESICVHMHVHITTSDLIPKKFTGTDLCQTFWTGPWHHPTAPLLSQRRPAKRTRHDGANFSLSLLDDMPYHPYPHPTCRTPHTDTHTHIFRRLFTLPVPSWVDKITREVPVGVKATFLISTPHLLQSQGFVRTFRGSMGR